MLSARGTLIHFPSNCLLQTIEQCKTKWVVVIVLTFTCSVAGATFMFH